MSAQKWPENCVWAEPTDPRSLGSVWETEDAEGMRLDTEGEDLLEIKAYYDDMVDCGRLNADYTLNMDYDSGEDADSEQWDEDEEWEPETGEEFWDGECFMADAWEMTMLEHLNCLKTEPTREDPASTIQRIIGYEFINENLIRQAFTRRAFAAEHGLTGDSEELEFFGDAALNAAVTREIMDRFMRVDPMHTDAPFQRQVKPFDEGLFSKIRSGYVCREYLASRATELGLGKYILYGSGERETEAALEDAMEALIGAVAVDSLGNRDEIDGVVDRLLCLQLDYPDPYLKKSYYDVFNSWHQKHFGRMPEYEILEGRRSSPEERRYYCTICFFLPENEMGLDRYQRIEADADGRSKARELAAEFAYRFVVMNGLWIRLEDAGIIPKEEDSINQLQELFQKKYLDAPAEYSFVELEADQWKCVCVCAGIAGYGTAGNKKAAKKKAAYKALKLLMEG